MKFNHTSNLGPTRTFPTNWTELDMDRVCIQLDDNNPISRVPECCATVLGLYFQLGQAQIGNAPFAFDLLLNFEVNFLGKFEPLPYIIIST